MSFRAGLVQLRSGRDMARNLADATVLIREAADRGARLVMTPEMTNIIEPDRPRLRALAQDERNDPSVAAFADLARDLGIWLLIGSLALKGVSERLLNRSLLYAPAGGIAARYDKVHLFDIDLPSGERIRESDAYGGGASVPIAALPWGAIGLTICYDLRFPALYRALAQQGAAFLAVPSAFTVPTGEAHWHVLLRARAIETGAYVMASAQGGLHDSGRQTFGHSLVASPWGEIIVEAGTEPGIVLAEIDPLRVADMRRRIPAWRHDAAFRLKELCGLAS